MSESVRVVSCNQGGANIKMAQAVTGVVSIDVLKSDAAAKEAKMSVVRIVAKTSEAAAEAKELLTFTETEFMVPKYVSRGGRLVSRAAGNTQPASSESRARIYRR
jgi:hypothetical protein